MLALMLVCTACAQFILDVEPLHLGNYYIALTNSLWAMRHCKSTCVVSQPTANVVFQPPFTAVWRANSTSTEQLQHIKGAFYFNVIRKFIDAPPPLLVQRVQVLCPYVDDIRKNLPALAVELDKYTGDDTLVVHIRSGDIFRTAPHQRYWQPPLGYYQFAARSFRKIAICTQNLANPVAAALHTYCQQSRGSENCLLLTDRSVQDDVAFLIRARNLAIGYGSFGVAIWALSNSMQQLFFPTAISDFAAFATLPHSMHNICGNTSMPVYTTIWYNVTQVTRGESWKASPKQLASLLLDDLSLLGIKLVRNEI